MAELPTERMLWREIGLNADALRGWSEYRIRRYVIALAQVLKYEAAEQEAARQAAGRRQGKR